MRKTRKKTERNEPFYDSIYERALEFLKAGKSISSVYDDRGINILKILVPIIMKKPSEYALDVGCGLGQNSLALSCKYNNVVAADTSRDALRVVSEAAKKENSTNVHPLLMDALHMPLKSGVFSFVICSGALEWIPVGHEQINDPNSVQKLALREMQRVLCKKGIFWIGIENRIGYNYLIGGVDHHSGLKFVTFLPRSIADSYSKMLKKQTYKNYLYSYWELSKLLYAAGIVVSKSLFALPSYSNPKIVINTKTPDQTRRSIERIRNKYSLVDIAIVELLLRLRLLKLLFPSFIIIGAKIGEPKYAQDSSETNICLAASEVIS